MFARFSTGTKMGKRTRLGLDVLEAALLLGVLGDALLRATPWGLNALMWAAALVAAIAALMSRWRAGARGEGVRWLFIPIIFFSAAFAWRDAGMLNFLDLACVLAALSMIALRSRGGQVKLGGVMEYALGACVAAWDAAFSSFSLALSDIKWKEIPRSGWSRHFLAVLRGLLLAVPLLLIFGALLVAADAVFENLVNKTLHIDSGKIFSHLFLFIFFAWTTAGFLRGLLVGKEVSYTAASRMPFISLNLNSTAVPTGGEEQRSATFENQQESEQSKRTQDESVGSKVYNQRDAQTLAPARRASLGIVEIGTVLGLLDALFLSFVLVQVRYFFGGSALAKVTPGLTYAEYARRGFFELVWVATLVLPLLLFAHWLLRKENPLHERIFRILAGTQVALVFIIMASALGRMRVYMQGYGLTEQRLFTTAFMAWLALVFAWFVLTVLRGQRERFACGALVAAFLMVAALNFINPDDLIVRTNLNQANAVVLFDVNYATTLSADAVPALLNEMSRMTDDERCVVANRVMARRERFQGGDWRTWNLSRARASRMIEANASAIESWTCAKWRDSYGSD
ncbi:MAG: hypothetical protein AUG51_20675 [Acidobacteria bacterium 13_1_20CM_3_53_8]|nr:MAG: hypothetical protein AUG51_20675 [Acidobacteria bacterium 13_1_20CM_3_53_8]